MANPRLRSFHAGRFQIVLPHRQQVTIGDHDPAEHGADDPYKALVGPTDEQVFEVRGAAPAFVRRSVNGPVLVPRVAADGGGRERVLRDDPRTKVAHEADSRGDDTFVASA